MQFVSFNRFFCLLVVTVLSNFALAQEVVKTYKVEGCPEIRGTYNCITESGQVSRVFVELYRDARNVVQFQLRKNNVLPIGHDGLALNEPIIADDLSVENLSFRPECKAGVLSVEGKNPKEPAVLVEYYLESHTNKFMIAHSHFWKDKAKGILDTKSKMACVRVSVEHLQ